MVRVAFKGEEGPYSFWILASCSSCISSSVLAVKRKHRIILGLGPIQGFLSHHKIHLWPNARCTFGGFYMSSLLKSVIFKVTVMLPRQISVCLLLHDRHTSSACRTSASLCNVAADGDRWLSNCARGKTDQVLLKAVRLVQYQEEVLVPIQVCQDNFAKVVNEMRAVIHQEKAAGKQHFRLHKPIFLMGYIYSTCVFLLSCCMNKG